MADQQAREVEVQAISLVSDALQKSGKLQKEDLVHCIEQLSKKAEQVKSQVYGSVYQKYTEFLLVKDHTLDYQNKVQALTADIQTLNNKIDNSVLPQLKNATKEHSKLTKELSTTNAIIVLLENLLKVDEYFSRVTQNISQLKFYEAAHALGNLKKQLEDLSQDIDKKIFQPLWAEYSTQKTILTDHLERAWSGAVTWTPSEVPSVDSLERQLKTSLSLGHAKLADDLQDVIAAMQGLGILDKKLKVFAKKLLQYLLRPLVLFPSIQVTTDRSKQIATLKFSRDSNRPKKLEAGVLYRKILDVMEFVRWVLFEPRGKSTVDDAHNFNIQGLFGSLGKLVWPVLSENLLIKDFLSQNIPSTSSDLEKYKEVIQETDQFEEQLVNLGFILKEDVKLSSYAKDVNLHFANKKCQDLLAAARDLMKSEVHNMVLITPDDNKLLHAMAANTSDDLLALIDQNTHENDKNGEEGDSCKTKTEKVLSELTFQLPRCSITESNQKLVDMAYEILQEASTSSPECALQLFCTVRNIFEMFCHVVPMYHQNSLATLPQLAALHHNNCMYIVHHLQTLGVQFRPSLPSPLNESALASFMDLVPMIRSLGEKCFLEQMRRQRDQLLEIVRLVGGFGSVCDGDKVEEIERAIKQVVYQLVHLSKVWWDVLPVDIYCKTLGALCNVVLGEFIDRVLELEDISATESPQLNSLLSLLANRLPEVFQKDEKAALDLSVYVRNWKRFNELVNILDSNLQHIVERWEDGKGPLAHLFSASEVRDLIRALFQNSDIRANALARIKAA